MTDLIWLTGNTIEAIFEVEATTTMTSALLRGSNVAKDVDKYMVLPEERQDQFEAKLRSPLFRDYFENENWKLIYFDALRQAYQKAKADVDIAGLVNKRARPSKKTRVAGNQRQFF